MFTGHYTEKADVFSLGTLFFAILERDFIVIEGKAIYGAFVDFHGVGKLGLGFAMANVDSSISIAFSSHAQGLRILQRVVMEALRYDSTNRPSAQDIYDKVMNILRAFVRIQQQFRFMISNSSRRRYSSSASTRNSRSTIPTSHGRVVKSTAPVSRAMTIKMNRQFLGRRK